MAGYLQYTEKISTFITGHLLPFCFVLTGKNNTEMPTISQNMFRQVMARSSLETPPSLPSWCNPQKRILGRDNNI